MNSIAKLVNSIGQKAKLASESLRVANTKQKNNALIGIARQIDENKQRIIDSNSIDIQAAKNNNIGDALIDRLMLNEERLDSGLRVLIRFPNCTTRSEICLNSKRDQVV